jgi:hypothetical protein
MASILYHHSRQGFSFRPLVSLFHCYSSRAYATALVKPPPERSVDHLLLIFKLKYLSNKYRQKYEGEKKLTGK